MCEPLPKHANVHAVHSVNHIYLLLVSLILGPPFFVYVWILLPWLVDEFPGFRSIVIANNVYSSYACVNFMHKETVEARLHWAFP